MKTIIMVVLCIAFFMMGLCVHGLLDRKTENQPEKSINIVTDTYEFGEPGYTTTDEKPEFIETVKCSNNSNLATDKMGWEVETNIMDRGFDLIYNSSKYYMTYEQAKVEKCRQHKEAWDTVAKIKELKALNCN